MNQEERAFRCLELHNQVLEEYGKDIRHAQRMLERLLAVLVRRGAISADDASWCIGFPSADDADMAIFGNIGITERVVGHPNNERREGR